MTDVVLDTVQVVMVSVLVFSKEVSTPRNQCLSLPGQTFSGLSDVLSSEPSKEEALIACTVPK